MPHLGQGSPAADGPDPGPPAAGPGGVGLPAMRMPQMSQKSSLAESCPLGQMGIVPHFLARTVLVDLVSRVISSASVTCWRSRTFPVCASTTSTTLASSLAVSSLPD